MGRNARYRSYNWCYALYRILLLIMYQISYNCCVLPDPEWQRFIGTPDTASREEGPDQGKY